MTMSDDKKDDAPQDGAEGKPQAAPQTAEEVIAAAQAAAAEGSAAEGSADEAEAAEAEALAALEAERDELKKQLMYALAETENVRKRAERDRRDAETYGGSRLARDLLAVHDNLDRALEAADDSLRAQASAFVEGVELTRNELLSAFAKHKIEKVTPETGAKFDPNLHQAMFEAPAPGATPGTVIQVMQPGFTMAGRLLRPAMVGVAKAAPEASAAE
jgi:molecular chaperone GrpE